MENTEKSTILTSLKKYFSAKDFKKRFIIMMTGVFFMGFFLSLLIKVNLGTDPCSFMNLTVARRLGILFGTWQFLLNAGLFIIVIFYGRKYIGPGTIANMVLVGYIADFFGWLWDRIIPGRYFAEFPSRAIIFAFALFFFIIFVGFYMNADMGVAPYDAMPMLVSERVLKKVPFSVIRMCYDFLVIIIGVSLGGTPNIGMILMAFFLGPVISIVGRILGEKVFNL